MQSSFCTFCLCAAAAYCFNRCRKRRHAVSVETTVENSSRKETIHLSLSLSESSASPPCPHSFRALTNPVSTWNGDVVVVIITTLEVMGSRVAVPEATEARLTCIQTSACYVVTRCQRHCAQKHFQKIVVTSEVENHIPFLVSCTFLPSFLPRTVGLKSRLCRLVLLFSRTSIHVRSREELELKQEVVRHNNSRRKALCQ